jgi:molecular chaperone GrpE
MSLEWLEAVDSMERALGMAEPTNPLAAGLRALLEQMEAILERQGITRIGAAGEQFDPELHDAVGVVETDEVPDRTVVEVARSGYALGDRVLRPAQVIVSRREPRAG